MIKFLNAAKKVLPKLREECAGGEKRRVSMSLLSLLLDAKFQCDESDSGSLIRAVKQHVHEFSKTVSVLKEELCMLRSVIEAIYPNTSTQIKVFSHYTSIFKQFYVDCGENFETSEYIKTVKDVLRSKKEIMTNEQKRKAISREGKLSDRFIEKYSDVVELTIGIYNKVMNGECVYSDFGHFLVALQISTGARKIEILDPNVLFTRFDKTQKVIVFGVERSKKNIDAIDAAKFGHLENVIVQSGVAKDKKQRINKYVSRENWVPNKILVKPTIILTADQVIAGICHIRKTLGYDIDSFKGRGEINFKYGDIAAKEMFKESAEKASANGWQFGTHHARKIYADASFKLYANQIKLLTNKNIDRSIWARAVLAHEGGIETTLSYANVDVEFNQEEISSDIDLFKKQIEKIGLEECYKIITELRNKN